MSIAVFLSRILGLVRELVMAAVFGAGMVMDAYLVAFRIPNLLRDLFAEGALSQAFVSVFAKIEDQKEREELARKTQRILSLMLFVVTIGIVLFATPLVSLMAEGFAADPKKLELTVKLTKTLAPFLYFVSFAALAMGILNSLGSFFIPSMSSAAFNLVNVLVGGALVWWMWGSGPVSAIWGWTMGTLVAGFVQWSIQWPSLRGKGFNPLAGVFGFLKPSMILISFKDPHIKKILWIMAPAIFGVAATQINVFVSTIYATSLEEGSVSWLSYAFRLMHFPMGVFGVALSTATLPQLAKLVSDRQKFQSTLEYSLRLAIILAVGASAGLMAFGHPIVTWIYERGAFGALDSMQTSYAIYAYSVGLIGFVGLKIMMAAYYAFGAVWVPSMVSAVAIGLNVLGMEFLSRYFAHAGLALSTALVSILNLVILAVILKYKFSVSVFTGELVKTLATAIGLAAVVFLPCFYVVQPWLMSKMESGIVVRSGLVLGCVFVFGLLYVFMVALLRPEGRELIAKFKNKLLRKLR